MLTKIMNFSPSKSVGINNTYCSVPGCSSKGSTNKNVRFHLFPKPNKIVVKIENKFGGSESLDARKARQIKTKIDKNISDSMRICSLHFTADDYKNTAKQKKYLKPKAVPACNLPTTFTDKDTPKNDMNFGRHQRLERRNLSKDFSVPCLSLEEHAGHVPLEQTHSPDEIAAAESLLQVCCPQVPKMADFAVQVNTMTISTICDLIDTDSKLNSFTGLHSFTLLDTIVKLVSEHSAFCRNVRLTLKQKIMLTFCKLKTNISYVILGFLFNTTSQTCRNTVFKGVQVLAHVLGSCIRFPLRNEINSNIPKCFENFKNVRVVLDCTEVVLQRPKCLCCRIKCYSQYKSNTTIKFMTGVSPGGLLTFISKGYGGRTSDKTIFEESGLISMLDMGKDEVMVDKGFLIDQICKDYNIKVIRPPFLRNKVQLSAEEAKLNVAIARARVHVERANQRIKLFQILSQKLQWPLVAVADEIFTIACAIANLSAQILADNKF